jgi:anthranilate phosphoribosyltransferase
VLEHLIALLAARQNLTAAQIGWAVEALLEESVPLELKAAFLIQLALKGETAAEITAFARELRQRAHAAPLDGETRARGILDVVGTGGDRLGTFNISSTAALICCAAGVTVAKHGNRAATSQSGSADVLEALGVPIELPPDQAARALREHGFAFFFAPAYHPAFRRIAPVRKLCAERGQRTVFNLLGPLLNPARPSAMLLGVPEPSWCEPMARVLQSLDVERGMVVSGSVAPDASSPASFSGGPASMDELSVLGENTIAEFSAGPATEPSVLKFSPGAFPLQPASLADLRGGDARTNAAIVRGVLTGEDRGPRRDAVLLNAGAALVAAGRANSLAEGWKRAGEVIDRGLARQKLDELTRR